MGLVGLVVAGCGDDGPDTSTSAGTGSSVVASAAATTAGPASTLVVADPATDPDGSSPSSDPPTGSVTADDRSAADRSSGVQAGTGAAPDQATTGQPKTITPQVILAGDAGAFVSPSGNIACVMDVEYGASCWISDKEWTADEPSQPGCEDFDFGNAIDVTSDGVVWPCYSDFAWDPTAPALAYGDAMVVGPFRCDSAAAGVTCTNGSGRGFTLARADVVQF